MKPFVHLHLHTEYSLLDGATRIDDLLERCVEYNMPAVAVTDHGNMYCAWKFMKAAAKINTDEQGNYLQKVKPIIGCEFYLCDNLHNVGYENKEYYH